MRWTLLAIAVLSLVPGPEAAGKATPSSTAVADPYTKTFGEKKKDLVPTGRNTYMILEPGFYLHFKGQEDGNTMELKITVLDETKVIDGVVTRVVLEKEWINGELHEVARNYFAISKRTNNVYYFGEDVDFYENGVIVSHDGTWRSGVDGAKYGLQMASVPLLGARYYQEIAPGVALDRAEIMSLTEERTVPAGTFDDVLKIKETTPLEPGATGYKFYAPNVGLIIDGPMKLVKYGKQCS